ncbi:MAG: SBBP repeat-containing protein, partial [Candidatus Schekmanbacteria bacterium]|nr:SBBP repeat-containing protein [Candidatus Schekmanbacteria bacterium]
MRHVKRIAFVSIFISLLLIPAVIHSSNTSVADSNRIMSKAAKLQMPFIENRGQLQDKNVKFYANTFAGNVFVTEKGELFYGLVKGEASTRICETLIGAIPSTIKGESKSATKVNYFTGSKDNWKSNISTWDSVNLGEVYEGVELKLKAYGSNVEKLFYVNECGDVEDIKLKFDGAEDISVNENGELEVETELGTVKFTKPYAYQEIDGQRVEVKAEYLIGSSLSYGFQVASYNRNYPLIIDPLLSSTFIGGDGNDYCHAVALGNSGDLFIAGVTYSSGYYEFPATLGSYHSSYYNNTGDVFVSKFDNNLSTLLSSTYIGGSSIDEVKDLAIDSSGNIFIAGYTYSTDYPVTSGAFDTAFNTSIFEGSSSDVFVSKLDNSLSNLLASTYLGGNSFDYGNAIAIDQSGNIYIAGETLSLGFPVRTGGYTTSPYYEAGIPHSIDEVFVSMLNNDLSSLLHSTFVGGSGGETCSDIAIDPSGSVFITGRTSSFPYHNMPSPYNRDYPATYGDYYITPSGDTAYGSNVFVSMLDASLGHLGPSIFIAYIDGYNNYGSSITVDSAGNVFVTGNTKLSDYPITAEAYDSSFNGNNDVFVSKFNNNLTSLIASTFVGGSSDERVNSIKTDPSGNVYITGYTGSSDYPASTDAYDMSIDGAYDAFFSKFTNDLATLSYSTFLGGSGYDEATSFAIEPLTGNVYIAGYTDSPDYPVIDEVYDTSYNGMLDVFISKLSNSLDAIDSDNDGIYDFIDNCPNIYNPDQADTDHDGIGDTCDTCIDTDGDGFGNPGYPANTCPTDNCRDVYNPVQQDTDNDGIGDACDTCMDTDGDGYGDPGFSKNTCQIDNCPDISNPDQADVNNDGIGDACSPTDLIVSSLSATLACSGITINDTTKNNGSGDADASTTSFYLSVNSKLDAGDTLIGNRAVPLIKVGQVNTGSTIITLPEGTTPGSYYIIAKADGLNGIAETNENNNIKAIFKSFKPDLSITSL